MEGKGRLLCTVLMSATVMTGCSNEERLTADDYVEISISLSCADTETRAFIPEEDRINDLNLIIFEDSKAEILIWEEKVDDIVVRLRTGRRYTFFAMANLGSRIDMDSLSELDTFIYELQESDGYRNGIPMSGILEDVLVEKNGTIDIGLIRMAARISVRMDRSRLSEDVQMEVRGLRIGNCPKYVSLKGPSRITSRHGRFETGFSLTELQCAPLNIIDSRGLSDEVSVYMLENMQGMFPGHIEEDEEKILSADNPLAQTCSYIEIEIYYSSSELISYDSNLIYRFYLGDGLGSLDIERNCHYHITVTPEDDGLSSGGWRVDKSGIGPSTPVFRMMPGELVEGRVGDTLRVWCECYPRTAPFDPGYEELYYDKSRGIYDFMVDEDGHGVTLYLKKAGTGIIYMSAGEPVNRSGMVIVTVLP